MGDAEPQESRIDALSKRSRGKFRIPALVLFIVVLAVVAYFIGRSITSQWVVIRAHPWQLHVGWLVCSVALIWLDFSLLVQLWRILLHAFSQKPLGFWTAFRILVVSNFGKYIPGKVWSVVGMVFFLGREGYPARIALASTVLHQAYTIVSGIIFIAVVLGSEIFDGRPVVPLVIGVVACAMILYPPVFSYVLNRGLRLLRREPIQVRLSFALAIRLFAVYIVAWVMYGAAFWCLLHGLGVQPGLFWKTVASFAAAYLLGFLALFAPGGLGVREGVLSVLLATTLTPGIAALIAVVARLWMTLIELSQLIPVVASRNTRSWLGFRNKETP